MDIALDRDPALVGWIAHGFFRATATGGDPFPIAHRGKQIRIVSQRNPGEGNGGAGLHGKRQATVPA